MEEKVTSFLTQLYQSKPLLPEFISKKVLTEVGFQSNDTEVYKLMSVIADHSLNNLFSSIRNTKNNARRHKEQDSGVLMTKDVIRQLKRQGQDISKPYQCPLLFFKKEDDEQTSNK